MPRPDGTEFSGDIRAFFVCSLTASVFMAVADGAFSDRERARLFEFMRVQNQNNARSPDEILEFHQGLISTISENKEIVPHMIRDQSKTLTARQKQMVLAAAANMALSDGRFGDPEREVLGDLARWMNLDIREYIEWEDSFRPTVEEARGKGVIP